ncbi:MAG: fasciclin domain-containing protein [Granulosicoccus sp.]
MHLPIEESDDTIGDNTDATSLTLLEIVQNDGRFTSLAAALEATGLDGALGHAGDRYTVFAPTDTAYAALGQKAIDALFADPYSLRNILLYHLVPDNAVDRAACCDCSVYNIWTAHQTSYPERVWDLHHPLETLMSMRLCHSQSRTQVVARQLQAVFAQRYGYLLEICSYNFP